MRWSRWRAGRGDGRVEVGQEDGRRRGMKGIFLSDEEARQGKGEVR